MPEVIGYLSENALSKALTAKSTSDATFFSARTHQSETVCIPVYLGAPVNDSLEVQKKLTGYIVAMTQLQKLYVELTNGDPIGEDMGDGDYIHKGYMVTPDQMERLRNLVGYDEDKL